MDEILNLIESVSEVFPPTFPYVITKILILIFMFLRQCTNELANLTNKKLRNQGRTKGEGWSTAN